MPQAQNVGGDGPDLWITESTDKCADMEASSTYGVVTDQFWEKKICNSLAENTQVQAWMSDHLRTLVYHFQFMINSLM